MSRLSQITALAWLDARRNIRSKGIIFIIFIVPVLVWGAQLGILSLEVVEDTTMQNRDIYVINQDQPVGEVAMGTVFVTILNQSTYLNSSPAYGAHLQQPAIENVSNWGDYFLDHEMSPAIMIPANFTQLYLNYAQEGDPIPRVWIYLLPTDSSLQYDIEAIVSTITSNAPFSLYIVSRFVGTRYNLEVPEGEEVPSDIASWMTSFFLIYAALIAPMPLVTSSFARDNEKKTLESILAMPMSQFDILLGKFLGGAILLLGFSFMNIVGLFLYKYYMDFTHYYEKVNMLQIQITLPRVFFMFCSIYLTTLVALALGIAITSRMKEVRTAETTYNFVMLIPFAIIALSVLIMDPEPYNPIFLLPWPHSIAIIFKGMYPNSFLTNTMTGSYTGDIFIHIAFLLVYVFGSLSISAYLTGKGKLFSLGD